MERTPGFIATRPTCEEREYQDNDNKNDDPETFRSHHSTPEVDLNLFHVHYPCGLNGLRMHDGHVKL
jgi:hypothetical protein